MRILDLKLENYRQFHDEELLLNRPLTIITGDNGSGKTNFLEAIQLAISPPSQFSRSTKQRYLSSSMSEGMVKIRLTMKLNHEDWKLLFQSNKIKIDSSKERFRSLLSALEETIIRLDWSQKFSRSTEKKSSWNISFSDRKILEKISPEFHSSILGALEQISEIGLNRHFGVLSTQRG